MIKKGFIYFVIFIILTGLNFILTIKAYAIFNKQSQFEKIFVDISQEKNKLKQQFFLSKRSISNHGYSTEFGLADSRVANLKAFFRKYNSPLYDFAEKIVEVSDKYQFDYRLLPAIAMQESNLCRIIPENSYNCWGWGIYGSIITRFNSYDEAIEKVAKGIKENYLDKGLVTASAIMKKYTPSSPGSWSYGVNTFLKQLE